MKNSKRSIIPTINPEEHLHRVEKVDFSMYKRVMNSYDLKDIESGKHLKLFRTLESNTQEKIYEVVDVTVIAVIDNRAFTYLCSFPGFNDNRQIRLMEFKGYKKHWFFIENSNVYMEYNKARLNVI